MNRRGRTVGSSCLLHRTPILERSCEKLSEINLLHGLYHHAECDIAHMWSADPLADAVIGDLEGLNQEETGRFLRAAIEQQDNVLRTADPAALRGRGEHTAGVVRPLRGPARLPGVSPQFHPIPDSVRRRCHRGWLRYDDQQVVRHNGKDDQRRRPQTETESPASARHLSPARRRAVWGWLKIDAPHPLRACEDPGADR